MCSIVTEEKMRQITDSDVKSSTMLASNVFKDILDKIQSSNLNFQLQVSPFSAQISLKKSLVKDKSGNMLPPPDSLRAQSHEEIKNLVDKNKRLQKELSNLQSTHDNVVTDFTKACLTIKTLETQLKQEIKPVVKHSEIEAYADEIRDLRNDITALTSEVNERD